MTVYRTCAGCLFAKGPCGEREKLRQKLTGLGLTSVKFKCGWRRPEFRPGEAISISMITYDDGYDAGSWCEYVDGYFVGDTSASSKVLVFAIPQSVSEVFGGEIELRNNGYMRLSRSYVKRREGVPASFCKDCGNLSAISGHTEWCKHHPDADAFARQFYA